MNQDGMQHPDVENLDLTPLNVNHVDSSALRSNRLALDESPVSGLPSPSKT
jgi:hypothetical protein